jgi:hypothetical protein
MLALAVAGEGVEGQERLCVVDRDDLDAGLLHQQADVGLARRPAPVHHHPCLDERHGRDADVDGVGDEAGEALALRLLLQNRDDGRGVDHHQVGRPFSS